MRHHADREIPPCFVKTMNHNSINPNRSLDRYGANRYGEHNFLSSFIFLLGACFSFVFDVARYAFKLIKTSAQQSNKTCSESNDRFGLIEL